MTIEEHRAGVRIGVSVPGVPSHRQWVDLVKRIDDAGFDSLSLPEHFSPRMFAPMVALASAAEISSRLKLRTLVANVGLRWPAVLAREASTLSLLSEGRFELGLGLGYRHDELRQAGLPFASAGTRLEILRETLDVLRLAWSGEPVALEGKHFRLSGHVDQVSEAARCIPITIGGGGRQLLRFAGEKADGVCFVGVSQRWPSDPSYDDFTYDGLARQVDAVDTAARENGRTVGTLRKEVLVQHVEVTSRRSEALEALAHSWPGLESEQLDLSPYVLVGTRAHIHDQLSQLQHRFGLTDVTVLGSSLAAMEEVLR